MHPPNLFILLKPWKLDQLKEGKAWVKFTKADRFVKRESKKQKSIIQDIMKQEKAMLSKFSKTGSQIIVQSQQYTETTALPALTARARPPLQTSRPWYGPQNFSFNDKKTKHQFDRCSKPGLESKVINSKLKQLLALLME